MSDLATVAAVAVLMLTAVTFSVGFIKTVREGGRGFDEFDRAGFTLTAFLMGRVPKSDASSSLSYGDSAEISIMDGKIKVTPTRTISKTLS